MVPRISNDTIDDTKVGNKVGVAAPDETTKLLPTEGDDGNSSLSQKNLTGNTIALSCALLCQSYLLVGVFPYSGFMAMFLIPGLDEETAGRYAGLIASSFMFGRTFSSFEWGKAADVYGRVFVIRTSLLLSAIFTILFGSAPTFRLALFWRFVLGLSNGMLGPVKTLVSEVCSGNTKMETRMLAIVMGMWGYGFLLNPAISGYLSDPVKQYPDAEVVKVFEPILVKYPFLASNIVGCLFSLIAYFLVGCYVNETLPDDKLQEFNFRNMISSFFDRCSSFIGKLCRCCCPQRSSSTSNNILRRVSSLNLFKHWNPVESELSEDIIDAKERKSVLPKWISPSPSTASLVIIGPSSSLSSKDETTTTKADDQQQRQLQRNDDTQSKIILEEDKENQQEEDNIKNNNSNKKKDVESKATIRSLWNQRSTRRHLITYWFYSFLTISIDEMFPLYCISKDSGLAIQEKIIGNIFSGTGFFYIIIQYFLLTGLVDKYGVYNAFRIGSFMSIPLCCFIPISLWTNKNMGGQLNLTSYAFLSILYAIIRIFGSVTFSTLTMSTNRTVVSHHRATMNGLSMVGGSLAKAAGPAFTGLLFSSSVSYITPPFGSVFAYCIISIMGLLLAIHSLGLKGDN